MKFGTNDYEQTTMRILTVTRVTPEFVEYQITKFLTECVKEKRGGKRFLTSSRNIGNS